MYSIELKEALKNITTVKMAVTKIPEELKWKAELYKETSFLPEDYKLVTRYYCVENDIKKIPKCVCGNDLIPNKLNGKLGFTKFCSSTCSRSNKTNICSRNSNYKTFLADYDWLYQQRITLQKSVEQISADIGCSAEPIREAIRKHKIPLTKYNESNALVKSYLKDKDWLYQKHKIEHKSLDQIAEEIKTLTNFDTSRSTISIAIEKHGIIANSPNEYDQPFKHITNPHQEIIDYIKSIYDGEIQINNRSLIKKELDIYLPEFKLAIEYNGEYSHRYKPDEVNPSLRKGKEYHIDKTNACESKGVQLFHIYGWYWKHKKDIWKSMIANKLGKSTKIYAKNCIIKELNISEKNLFLNQNHLYGNDRTKYKYGLFYNYKLVSCMTFSIPRYNKKYDFELVRFATKINHAVVGGFSKLLKNFRKEHPGSIITYADRTYSQGKVYENNGFTLLRINEPSYWYTYKNDDTPLNRTNFMKENITSNRNDKRTEEQIMFEKGYHKTFDCGTKTYILK